MRIEFLLHGVLCQIAGADRTTIELTASESTIDNAIQQLQAQFPAMGPTLARTAVAEDDMLVPRSRRLNQDCQLALIPAVSGG